ncbi:CdaR family protein [Peribacillus kribbensis]|uniref:CdaR family protein n=1 Tax=Peribacillus kribbensis TaxID=356658 RepID=UPI0004222909|nr:CdaR family protein [Peribacillus kribbensis]
MDRFMNTPWFMKIVALGLTALLFISVNFQPNAKKGSPGFSPPSKTDTEVVQDIPVEVNYDRKNLIVTGAPQSVDVTLRGPKSIVVSAKNQRDFTVYLDLSDAAIGEQKVKFKVSNLSDKLTAVINPQQAIVGVQERVTKSYSVIPYFNEALLEEGYIAGAPTTSPESVRITGARNIIERISTVKANLQAGSGINETVQQRARVVALDRNQNQLNVSIEPSTVDIRVPVKIPSKKVSLIPYQTGKLPDGIELESIDLNPKQITLYGKQSVLDKLGNIRVPVDVSKVDDSTTYEQKIDTPEGVRKISDDIVNVSIKVKKADIPPAKEKEQATGAQQAAGAQQATKTFNNIKIIPAGLPDDYELTFASPSSGEESISVTGPADQVNAMQEADIQLSIDASNLTEGTSQAAIKAVLPKNVTGKLQTDTASVTVKKKEAA